MTGGALASAKSAVSTSMTSWFGKIRHWTSTEEEEGDEPYMPSTAECSSAEVVQPDKAQGAGLAAEEVGLLSEEAEDVTVKAGLQEKGVDQSGEKPELKADQKGNDKSCVGVSGD